MSSAFLSVLSRMPSSVLKILPQLPSCSAPRPAGFPSRSPCLCSWRRLRAVLALAAGEAVGVLACVVPLARDVVGGVTLRGRFVQVLYDAVGEREARHLEVKLERIRHARHHFRTTADCDVDDARPASDLAAKRISPGGRSRTGGRPSRPAPGHGKARLPARRCGRCLAACSPTCEHVAPHDVADKRLVGAGAVETARRDLTAEPHGCVPESMPFRRPMAVRTASTITTSVATRFLLCAISKYAFSLHPRCAL